MPKPHAPCWTLAHQALMRKSTIPPDYQPVTAANPPKHGQNHEDLIGATGK